VEHSGFEPLTPTLPEGFGVLHPAFICIAENFSTLYARKNGILFYRNNSVKENPILKIGAV